MSSKNFLNSCVIFIQRLNATAIHNLFHILTLIGDGSWYFSDLTSYV